MRAAVVRMGGEEVLVIDYAPDGGRHPLLGCLSDAEHSVAVFVLAGLSNQEIADIRRSSVRTVTTQVQSIYRKLGVGSRAELVVLLTPVR